jgi:hypothetical protein
MKAIAASTLLFAACATDPDPPESTQAQALRNQPGETIVVHGCSPGLLDLDNGVCLDPRDALPPPFGEPPRGPSPGGDGTYGTSPEYPYQKGYIELDSTTLAPGVTLVSYEFSLTAEICRYLCTVEAAALCVAVESACALGSTFTLGGATLPCAAAVITACAAAETWREECVQVDCK